MKSKKVGTINHTYLCKINKIPKPYQKEGDTTRYSNTGPAQKIERQYEALARLRQTIDLHDKLIDKRGTQ